MPDITSICPNCPLTPKQRQIIDPVRRLWLEHVFWTRYFIVSAVFNLPDLDAVTKRLLRNPTDIAEVLRPLYGNEKANKFEKLLKDHLEIAAKLVKAAKTGDTAFADETRRKWYANADEIATFLSSINPNWSRKVWQDMLYDHLYMTENEAIQLLKDQYDLSVVEYDMIQSEALDMANYMASGILKQFNI